jgi:hypothetical protein
MGCGRKGPALFACLRINDDRFWTCRESLIERESTTAPALGTLPLDMPLRRHLASTTMSERRFFSRKRSVLPSP